jgi:hypothetical protein
MKLKLILSIIISIFQLLFADTQIKAWIGNSINSVNNSIIFPINFEDGKNELITDIIISELKITINKNKLSKFNISQPSDENILSLLIAVDVSASMSGDAINNVKNGIKSIIEKLDNGDQIGVLTFSDKVKEIIPLTNNFKNLDSIINNINANGSRTEMYWGINRAIKLQNENQATDKIILVFSDGRNTSLTNEYKLEDNLKIANESNISIYTLGFNSSVYEGYLAIMEKIADETGGRYIDTNEEHLENSFNQAYLKIKNRLFLTITPGFELLDKSNILELKWNRDQYFTTIIKTFNRPATYSFDYKNTLNLWLIVLFIIIISIIIIYFYKRNKLINDKYSEEMDKTKEKISEVENKNKQLENEQSRLKQLEKDKNKKQSSKNYKKIKTINKELRHTKIISQTNSNTLKLSIKEGDKQEILIDINNMITIGRSSDNLIVLTDKTVSGHHCEIFEKEDYIFIKDLNSTNGTYQDGEKINNISTLMLGNEVRIGNTIIYLKKKDN